MDYVGAGVRNVCIYGVIYENVSKEELMKSILL